MRFFKIHLVKNFSSDWITKKIKNGLFEEVVSEKN